MTQGVAIDTAWTVLSEDQLTALEAYGTERAGRDERGALPGRRRRLRLLRGPRGRGPDRPPRDTATTSWSRRTVPAASSASSTCSTGQRAYLTALVTKPGRILAIDRADFRRHHEHEARALRHDLPRVRRAPRDLLRTGDGAGAIRIIGSRYSPEAIALRSVREPVAASAHVDRSRRRATTRRVLLASLGVARRRRAGRGHPHRDAAPADTGRVRRAPRPHLPTVPGYLCRSRGGRHRSRRASPPPCTARRKGSTRSRSTRWPSAGRPARARASRTTSGSPNGISGEELRRARRDPGACGSAPASTRRARSRACASSTAST